MFHHIFKHLGENITENMTRNGVLGKFETRLENLMYLDSQFKQKPKNKNPKHNEDQFMSSKT